MAFIGSLVHWIDELYTLRSAGARGLDGLPIYRHIAPLERRFVVIWYCYIPLARQPGYCAIELGFTVPAQPNLRAEVLVVNSIRYCFRVLGATRACARRSRQCTLCLRVRLW